MSQVTVTCFGVLCVCISLTLKTITTTEKQKRHYAFLINVILFLKWVQTYLSIFSLTFHIAVSLMNPEKISSIILVKFLVSTVLNLKLNVIKFDVYIVALDLLETWQITLIGTVIYIKFVMFRNVSF